MSDIYAVFNELALSPYYRNSSWTKHDAHRWLDEFSKLLKLATRKNVVGLRTYSHPHEIELVYGYTLLQWFNDSQFRPELRLRLQTLFTELSRMDEFPENQRNEPLIQYQLDGRDAFGLGAAHLLDSIAVSLNTGIGRWRADYLSLKILELLEEDDDLTEKEDTIRHMSEATHLQSHEAWISERLETSVRNGKDLLKKAKKWYPHLIFCKDAEDQVRSLTGGTPQFRRLITRLFDLENYCLKWEVGGFEVSAIQNASNESESTMREYGRLREFVCPDGETRSFGFHLKGLPGHWRIHIWPDVDGVFRESDDTPKKILIGYVGKHLPTSTG